MLELAEKEGRAQSLQRIEYQCVVTVDELEVFADIGAFAAEFGVPQPLRLSVELAIVPPTDDDLSTTFDYARIETFALQLASERISLIETFARRLALLCLEDEVVLAAEVRVQKPKALQNALAGTRYRVVRNSDR